MAFVVPTIFSAVDKFSAPARGMGAAMDSFAQKAEGALGRGERAFRKMTPVLGHAAKEFLAFASTAALAAGILKLEEFSFESIENYEKKLINLKATTGLAGKQFDSFKDKILDVAKASKTSAIDVADVFTIIAKANPDLLNNADAIGKIAAASVLASKATGAELAPATQSLTTIMSQFKIGADDAMKTVDAFAAASQRGKFTVSELEDGVSQFAQTAKKLGISVQESIAIETLASSFKKAGESSTDTGSKIQKMLGVFMNVRRLSPQIQSSFKSAGVSIEALRSSTVPLSEKLEQLQKIQGKSALITAAFGKKNADFIFGLLSQVGAYDSVLDKTRETGVAQDMASERMQTLSEAINRLKAAWVNMTVSTDKTTGAVSWLREGVDFLAEHIGTIVSIGGALLGFFITWKGLLWAGRAAMFAYNIYLGISAGLTGVYNIAIGESIVALNAAKIATAAAAAAQWLWNAAMSANPIALIVIGIAGLITLVVAITKYWNDWGAAVSVILGPFGFLISLVQSFRRNWDMITKSFAEGGILAGLKSIGKTLLDAVLQPIQQIMSLIAKFTGWDWAASAAKSIDKFRAGMGVNVTTDESGNPLQKEVIDNRATQHQAMVEKYEQTNNAHVGLTIDNRSGNPINANNPKGVGLVISSTMPAYGGGGSW